MQPGHDWVKQAEKERKALFDKLAEDHTAERVATVLGEGRQAIAQLKKSYIAAYIASHSKARLRASPRRRLP